MEDQPLDSVSRLPPVENKTILNRPVFNKVLIVDDDQAICRTNARYMSSRTKR